MTVDFSSVTESAAAKLSPHAMAMNYHRYRTAADYCEGKDVLEVACGIGQGLGYLARKARKVVGGDFTESLVQSGRRHYQDRIPLYRLDAHHLPFKDHSFDVVILFEAIYYLSRPDLFLSECRRVLRPNGVVLIATVNKDWKDFNPSPFSTRYFSAGELGSLLEEHGFRCELFGAFPVGENSAKSSLVSLIKKTAVSLHLVPKTMKGKELLKRIFYGKLIELPAEISEPFPGLPEYVPPLPIDSLPDARCYQVLYAAGRLGK